MIKPKSSIDEWLQKKENSVVKYILSITKRKSKATKLINNEQWCSLISLEQSVIVTQLNELQREPG